MLELPTLELEERINQELMDNPALEEGRAVDETAETEPEAENEQQDAFDEIDWDNYLSDDDDTPDYKLYANNSSADDEPRTFQFSSSKTFSEDLISQLGEMRLSEKTDQLAQYIVGNLDDDGYLRRDVEQMVDDFAFIGGDVTDEQMSEALSVVQSLEPAGVAARTLQECLSLQLDRLPASAAVELAKKIVRQCFDEFSRRQYERILKRFSIDEEQLREALERIQTLNPKPGSAWATSSLNTSEQITPDFIVENINGRLQVYLNNQNMPDLRVSAEYSAMIQDFKSAKPDKVSKEQKAAILFAKEKIDSARWFIDAIRQRNETLLATMRAIVQFQAAFFDSGDEAQLRPMILKDIAALTGFDISTISRVSNSKYAQTEFGILPLRAFFSETMRTESGEEISNKEVKRILRESVDAEDRRKPLTDDQLAAILKSKGYVIARRTIAKYRERMGIPVARLRKEL